MTGSTGAMLVVRSTDGGANWGPPITLINDGSAAFNDKGSIAADAADAHFVYAVWDRLATDNTGPTWFARTTDGGTHWEAARRIYDPGVGNQTIGNVVLALPGSTLMVVFTEFDAVPGGTSATLKVIRSIDRGLSWSAPSVLAAEQSAGTRDPVTGAMVRDGADLPAAAVGPGGAVYVVWQSPVFAGGARDAIAIAHSNDAGMSWSMPVRASGDLAATAFIPNVQVRADGMIGVGYYDLRQNVPASGSAFLPLFVTSGADTSNRTDVFLAFGP